VNSPSTFKKLKCWSLCNVVFQVIHLNMVFFFHLYILHMEKVVISQLSPFKLKENDQRSYCKLFFDTLPSMNPLFLSIFFAIQIVLNSCFLMPICFIHIAHVNMFVCDLQCSLFSGGHCLSSFKQFDNLTTSKFQSYMVDFSTLINHMHVLNLINVICTLAFVGNVSNSIEVEILWYEGRH
jgi:hypothetical protein